MRILGVIGLLVAGTLLVSGCVNSDYMAIGERTYPPRPDDYVIDVYVPIDTPVNVHKSISNAKPLDQVPADATTIGRIDTSGAAAASWSSVIKDAKKKARRLGGDAIVIRQWGHTMTGTDNYGRTYYGKNLSMTVIRCRF